MGVFVLGKNDIGEENLQDRLGLDSLTGRVSIKHEIKKVDPDTLNFTTNWLEERWEILQALDRHFSKETSTILFKELEEKIIFCMS